MRAAAALSLVLSLFVLLMVIVNLDGARTTLLALVPSAHTDLANWLVIIVALAGGISISVGVAVAGFVMVKGR